MTRIKQTFYPFFLIVLMAACGESSDPELVYESDTLVIHQLTPNVFQHTTYLLTDEWGKVGCNGIIYSKGGASMVFDTPIDDSVSIELIEWIENEHGDWVAGVVINHFHEDCLGGLQAFHDRSIPSYGHARTIEFAQQDSSVVPQVGFASMIGLDLRGSKVLQHHFGAAHTHDNSMTYLPEEKLVFGGCAVKSMGAGKGNLADADTMAWSQTIRNLKTTWKDVAIVVPGHGAVGGPELLDYTIDLFDPEN